VSATAPGTGPVFRDVDADDAARLVAMMDATDRWPAVRVARAWVLDQVAPGPGSVVVDVGSGPGTFGRDARARGALTLDIDRSTAMLAEVRRREPTAVVAQADIARLPIGDRAADLVHAERVLQWSHDPGAAVAELRRITAGGGWFAVTDTDWGTFAVDNPGGDGVARWSEAALRWVPHPTVARSLPRLLRDAGATDVAVRTDAVSIATWDPDDPLQADGPPGLPIRTIVDAALPDHRDAILADVDALASLARRGRFFATLTLVTALGRF
jgi:SAM-dependent methyltransferase